MKSKAATDAAASSLPISTTASKRHRHRGKRHRQWFPDGRRTHQPMFTPVYGQLGTTFGGNHLACSAALAVLDVIEQEKLIENAAQVGDFLMTELRKFPQIKDVRGRGLMIGLEFEAPIKVLRLRLLKEQHVFTGVSGTNVLRLLPPLCLSMDEAKEFLKRFKKVL